MATGTRPAPAKAAKAAKAPAAKKTEPAPKKAKKAVPKPEEAAEPKSPAKAKPAPRAKGKAKAEPKAPARKPAAAPKAPEPEPVPVSIVPEEAAPLAKGRTGKRQAAPPPLTAAPAGEPVLTPHAQAILQAICEGRAVELIFKDSEANPPHTFEPRQLLYDTFSQSWFVWGWDRRYNAERHHRLDQLAEINPVEGVGRAAQGPFKDGTPANRIGGWLGGEPIPVKAVILKQWIYAVRQAPAPFPEFRMADLEEGKAEVSFTATDLRAIARWCMQFGDGIQVLEPKRLVDRIKQVGITWGGRPRQEAEANRPQATQQPHARPEHKPEPKPVPRPEPKPAPRPETKAAPRHEPRHEAHRHEPPHRHEAPPRPMEEKVEQSKPGRVEIRIEKL